MVVGGGNTAVEEAIFLTNFASKVIVVHRRDHFRAEKILQERLFKNPKIEVVWDSAIEEIVGTGEPRSVDGVRIKNVKTGKITERKVDGVFVAIGHAPATELFKGQLETKPSGYLDHGAGFDGDLHSRRVRGRRRQGRHLPAGGDGRRHGLHGGARSGEVPASRRCRAPRAVEHARRGVAGKSLSPVRNRGEGSP